PKANGPGFPGAHREPIVRRCLRPRLLRIHPVTAAVDDVRVDPVLHVRCAVASAEEPLRVGLVLGEKQRPCTFTGEDVLAEVRMRGDDCPSGGLPEPRPCYLSAP